MHTPEQIQTSKNAIIGGFFRREIRDAMMDAKVKEPAQEAVIAYARTQTDPSRFLLGLAKQFVSEREAEIIELLMTASRQHTAGDKEEAFSTSEDLVEAAVQLRDAYDAAQDDQTPWAAE